MHTEPDMADTMREAGAIAYLAKGGPTENLVQAIRACNVSLTQQPPNDWVL